jgi:hypothetical protein
MDLQKDVIDLLRSTEVTWGGRRVSRPTPSPHVIISRVTGWLYMGTRYIISVLN